MRIAVISRTFARSGGGAESYSVAIAAHLAARHEVHVFAQEFGEAIVGVKFHKIFCLGQKPRWINQTLFALATWWATRRGFDIVHSHENTWHGDVQTVHVRPLRLNLFGQRTGLALGLRWLKVALSPRLMAYLRLEGARFKPAGSRRVVATSEHLLGECLQAYPHAAPRLSVITPGATEPANPPTPGQARQALGMPPDTRLLLFAANDYARKGLDTLLHALAQLPVTVHLMVAGHPGQIPRYHALAASLNVADRVHFLGSQPSLENAYMAADMLVHPTLEDSFAMVVLEAMAHGLPVVVSGPRFCGISRQLQDGQQALLLDDPKDTDALASAITRVLDSDALSEGLKAEGRAFARQHSWTSACLQYESLFTRILHRD